MIYIKIKWVVATLYEYMNNKFEANQTKIKGGYQFFVTYMANVSGIDDDELDVHCT